MVKICLRGECKNVQLATNNGESARCTVRLELDAHQARAASRIAINRLIIRVPPFWRPSSPASASSSPRRSSTATIP